MRFFSTRQDTTSRDAASARVGISAAITQGLAPDGGLYIPEGLPDLSAEINGLQDKSLSGVAKLLLRPFFEGDPLAPELDAIVDEALNFPIPLVDLKNTTALLEVYWGPSAAFKDVGARFLAGVMTRVDQRQAQDQPLTILVATSGDTGGAVAAAFHGRPGVNVVILYPDGMVSARQAHQLGAFGDNVRTFAVQSDFDACQSLVKAAFQDPEFRANFRLSSANSINIGRLLPQATYHAWAALEYKRRHGKDAGVIIPSGNLGNAVSAIWARSMGFPIREVVLATNANPTLSSWLETGKYEPKPTQATLANAMDVGAPSNMERLLAMFSLDDIKKFMQVVRVTDEHITETITNAPKVWGQVVCPHTACAIYAREVVGGEDWIVNGTAHPAKFETIVEPLIGERVELPPALAELLSKESNALALEPNLDDFRAALLR